MSALEDKQDAFGGPEYLDGGNPSADVWTGVLEDEIDSFGGPKRGLLYEVQANKGAVNGYAPLDATALVASDDLGTGGSDSGTKFLLDDQTFRILAAGDIPSIAASKTTSGIFPPARLGTNSVGAGLLFLSDDGTYKVVPTVVGAAGGTVTNVSVATANGFSGTVANSSTTPAITLTLNSTITEGAGLAGNTYDLSANRILAMGTPSTLTATSTNSASGTTHSHAITASSNPGAAAAILATDGSGFLTLKRLTLTDYLFINASTANLYLKDTSTGFQASTTGIINPQSGNAFRTTAYTSGVTGWNISNSGDAEFNNVRIRGELAASVFKISEISATAGTFGVFYSASTIADEDCMTPASTGLAFTIRAKNSDAGGMLFAVGDRVRIKSWTGAGISDAWATITDRTNHTTFTEYDAVLQSGSTNATFTVGTAIVDYGPSGTGFITLSTDGTVGSSPNMTMATHAGSPWSAFTTLLRLGNLNGSYNYATDIYGLGIGQYGTASKSWLTIDQTNGFRIGNNTTVLGQWDVLGNATFGQVAANKANVFWNTSNQRLEFRGSTNGTLVQSYIDTDGSFVAGAGDVKLNSNGLRISAGTAFTEQTKAVTWWDGSERTGGLFNVYNSGTSQLNLRASVKSADTTGIAGVSLETINSSGVIGASLVLSSRADISQDYVWAAGDNFRGITIGSTGVPTHMVEAYGTGWFQGNGSASDAALIIPASTHVTSNRAAMELGSWSIGQDSASDGTKDFYIYDAMGAAFRLGISTAGALSIFVGGALKTVVVGAADSGGSGFKMLRVAN